MGAWPAFTMDGEVQVGDAIDSELVYTASFDERVHVVFNGWPLFCVSQDEEAGQTAGHGIASLGRVWYLIGPDGRHEEFEDPARQAG